MDAERTNPDQNMTEDLGTLRTQNFLSPRAFVGGRRRGAVEQGQSLSVSKNASTLHFSNDNQGLQTVEVCCLTEFHARCEEGGGSRRHAVS
jgi:hypothetical protein